LYISHHLRLEVRAQQSHPRRQRRIFEACFLVPLSAWCGHNAAPAVPIPPLSALSLSLSLSPLFSLHHNRKRFPSSIERKGPAGRTAAASRWEARNRGPWRMSSTRRQTAMGREPSAGRRTPARCSS
ncbi:unnamed protein product, partial [Ectocarpus sp. 12 AP-2014]